MPEVTREQTNKVGDKGEFEFYAAMKVYEKLAEYDRICRYADISILGLDIDKMILKIARKDSKRQKRDRVDLDIGAEWVQVSRINELADTDIGEYEVITPEYTLPVFSAAVDAKAQESCYLPRDGRSKGTGNLFFETDLFLPGNQTEYWAHLMPRDEEWNCIDIVYMPKISEVEVATMPGAHYIRRCDSRGAGYIVPAQNVMKRADALSIKVIPCVKGGIQGKAYFIAEGRCSPVRFHLGKLTHDAYFVSDATREKWRHEWEAGSAAA